MPARLAMGRPLGKRSWNEMARMRLELLAMAGLVTGLTTLAGGCTTTIRDHRGFLVDQTLVDTVAPGIDNKASVERTLGRPTFSSQYGDPSWYYVSIDTKQPPFHGPRPTKETVLRVRFDAQGNVATIDQANVSHVAEIKPDRASTPALGRKRSFFEDLFGNIGTVSAVGGPSGGPGGGSGGGGGPNGS
jgi:outer membrane protein assembly factor BamE (lipoprotein component of BamABCDE complex)